jgi:NTE family protein
MNVEVHQHVTVAQRRLPFECIALLLQGGRALGAYQAGAHRILL